MTLQMGIVITFTQLLREMTNDEATNHFWSIAYPSGP
jgi:hypothetical protein